MPKLDVTYDTNLGNVKMPSWLMTLLEEYCQEQHTDRSKAVRAAISDLLEAENNSKGNDNIGL